MKHSLFFTLLFLVFSGCTYTEEVKSESLHQSTPQNQYQEDVKPKPSETKDPNLYTIDYVYDGDTYAIIINGEKKKIRVLGIDTPEKKGGFRPEGCFGNEASIYVKHKLLTQKVSLLRPKNYNNTDKYGRLLRYVFLDGHDFGAHLIEEGYASSYKQFPHERQTYYNQLEKKAQYEKKGMWNPKNCEYWGQKN